MLKNIFINYLANAFLLKRNLDWHRKVLVLSFPAAFIGILIFSEYLIYRLKRAM